MNLLEQAVVTTYPELQRLIDFRESGGWGFQPITVRGELELVVGARVWPLGWTDALAELPAPGTPGASTLVIGRRPTLWTPGR